MKPFEEDDDYTGYASRPLGAVGDFCSREGAETLKRTIEAYWRERGQDVMISLQNVGFHPAIRAARYDVRSDMVNGSPRSGAAKRTLRTANEVCVEDFDPRDDIVFEH